MPQQNSFLSYDIFVTGYVLLSNVFYSARFKVFYFNASYAMLVTSKRHGRRRDRLPRYMSTVHPGC